MPQPIYVTREGLEKLKSELENLRTVRRPDLAARIQLSRESGGTAGNAEYEEAKNELAFIEGRVLTLDNSVKNAELIEERQVAKDKVDIGSTVRGTKKGKPLNTPSPAAPKPTLPWGRSPMYRPLAKAFWARASGKSPR